MNARKRPVTGDVYLASLEPTRGSEQGKTRPVIVFQNTGLARYTKTLLCVPLTSNLKRLGIPGTCFIPKGEAALPRDSVALGYQLRALDRSRLQKHCGVLNNDTVETLGETILQALGISLE